MSVEYQFPCDCGFANRVTVSDAGKKITCTKCGSVIELPGMREIKKLEPFEEKPSDEPKSSSWSYEKGIFFSFGMGAVCLGLVAAGICFYIGRFSFLPNTKPNVRGDWIQTGSQDPPVETPVWGFAPEPNTGQKAYELTMFDRKLQKWIFEDPDREPMPKEYFSKWGNSYRAGIESSVQRSRMQDLWKFWYETEPQEPLKEWEEPAYSINSRFAMTFYSFAGVGGVIALVGVSMVFYSVMKK